MAEIIRARPRYIKRRHQARRRRLEYARTSVDPYQNRRIGREGKTTVNRKDRGSAGTPPSKPAACSLREGDPRIRGVGHPHRRPQGPPIARPGPPARANTLVPTRDPLTSFSLVRLHHTVLFVADLDRRPPQLSPPLLNGFVASPARMTRRDVVRILVTIFSTMFIQIAGRSVLPDILAIRRPRHSGPPAALLAVAVLIAGACGDGSDGRRGGEAQAPQAAAHPVAGDTASPQRSPRAAVEAFLSAELAGDHVGSLRLLTAEARATLTPSAWSRRRSESPVITGFSVERADGDAVVAVVEHRPGLDPFIGLSPGRTRETWRARREGLGWLLLPEPEVEPLYPPSSEAPPVALAWARAAQACDADAARELQAIRVLFGQGDAPARLCGSAVTLTVGAPVSLAAGPAAQELVAQYGAETHDWARAVAVTGSDRPFHLVLAPIGSVWRVIGVFEP